MRSVDAEAIVPTSGVPEIARILTFPIAAACETLTMLKIAAAAMTSGDCASWKESITKKIGNLTRTKVGCLSV